jgi:hypothetical protein
VSTQGETDRAQAQAYADYQERLRDPRRGSCALDSFDVEHPRSQAAKRVLRALAAVDRIHRFAGLPQIPVRLREAVRGVGGYSCYDTLPLSIEVSTKDPSPARSFLCELGREVDHLLLGDGELWGSETSPFLRGWWQALSASESFQVWQEVAAALDIGDPRWRYLESARVAFARSYAQWVMERSGDPHLRSDLRAEHERELFTGKLPETWGTEEFEPIASALDRAFADAGLLHLDVSRTDEEL